MVTALCLVVLATPCLADFLQATLDRIQKERHDTVLELNHTDHNSEFDEEIIFDTNSNSIESIPEETYELNNDNSNSNFEHLQHYTSSPQQMLHSSLLESTNEGEKPGESQGYYYYFYPLNNYLQKLPQQEQHQAESPMKDTDVMNTMMESMMKNGMMNMSENKVTPLFKAMSWFIGTALIFVVSILLMPRFRVKKAKELMEAKELGTPITLYPLTQTVHRYKHTRG